MSTVTLIPVDQHIDHLPGLPIPVPHNSSEYIFQSNSEFDDNRFEGDLKSSQNLKRYFFTEANLNDFVREKKIYWNLNEVIVIL